MPQTSVVGFALIVGFIVFITIKGELPAYLCVIGIGRNCPQPGQGSSLTGSSPVSSTSTGVNSGGNVPPNTLTGISPVSPVTTVTSVDYSGVGDGGAGDAGTGDNTAVTSTISYD